MERTSILFKTIAKEIVIEGFRNHHQLLQVDALALKEFVDVRLLAVDFFGQPFDGAALFAQFVMNQVAHMHVFHSKVHSLLFGLGCKDRGCILFGEKTRSKNQSTTIK